jgi:hypothetical protein
MIKRIIDFILFFLYNYYGDYMKHRIFMGILIVLLIILVFISFFPLGIKNYKYDNLNIKVPRLVFNTKKTKNELRFISFRDASALKEDINKALKDYQMYMEDDKKYYYDIKQNIYIKEYKIKKGFFTNEIIIKLDR